MREQPEALRLADWCDANSSGIYRPSADAAAELRRLHAQCERMRDALVDTLDFVERHSNRWDGVNGKHPAEVVENARAALKDQQ